jgi:hypothetical protein
MGKGVGRRITLPPPQKKIKQVRILGLAKSTSIVIALIVLGTRDISFDEVTKLGYGRLRKLGLIPGMCKRCFFSRQHADRPVNPIRVFFGGMGMKFGVDKAATA